LGKAIVNRLGLPKLRTNGSPSIYRLVYYRENQETELRPNETLADAGVQNDDVLRLFADMQAGGRVDTGVVPDQGIQPDVQRIYALLEELKSQANYKPGTDRTVERIRQEIENNIEPLSIPIIISEQEREPIPTVRADRLHVIEEYRDEEDKWYSIAWAFIGAAFGVIVNWATSETGTLAHASVIVLVAFGILGGLAWLSARQFQKRAEQYKHIVLYGGGLDEKPDKDQRGTV
jgi:hypothetical protein